MDARARRGRDTRARDDERPTVARRPRIDRRARIDRRPRTTDATTRDAKGSSRERDVVGTAGAGEPERGLSGGESAERWDKLAVVVADGEFLGGDGVGRRRA